jgi:hypothetical protein
VTKVFDHAMAKADLPSYQPRDVDWVLDGFGRDGRFALRDVLLGVAQTSWFLR